MEHTYRAIFFDLDGTLLPMELDEFMRSYFKKLGTYVARFGVSPETFMAGMKAGIKSMATHDDGLPNAEAFWKGYFTHVDREATDWDAELAQFYDRDFGEIGAAVKPNPAAARAVGTLAAKGYPLVLATMPMFPRRAVEWRLRWSGVDPSCFARITSFNNSTSVKPKLSYYAENLAAADVCGIDVLMVGNNTVEDLAAQKLGADVYLVTDVLLDPTDSFDLTSVNHGSLAQFADWAASLPTCVNPATNIDEGLVSAERLERTLVDNYRTFDVDKHASAAASFDGFTITGIGD